jgi:hypothetical protein
MEDCGEEQVCLSYVDENDQFADGHCSQGCNDAIDCPESPGGTAEPACIETGGGGFYCALDCENGKTCPLGMECIDFNFASYCF